MDRDAKPLTHHSVEWSAVTRKGLVAILALLAALVVAGLMFVARDRAGDLSPFSGTFEIGKELSMVQGVSLKAAYATLYAQSSTFRDFVEFAYPIPKGGIVWKAPPPEGVFDLSAEVSTGGKDEVAKRLKEVFGQVFSIRGTYESSDVPVLLLKRSSKRPEALRIVAGLRTRSSSGPRTEGTRNSYEYRGPVIHLADWLQVRLRVPVLDETGVTEGIQVDLSYAQEEQGALREELLSSLEENGLSLETAIRIVERLVMSR